MTEIKDILRQVPWRSVVCILLCGVLISGGIAAFRHYTKPEAPSHTVTFQGSQGTVLAQRQVTDGGFALPPRLKNGSDSIAFRCWSQPLYNIRGDATVTPVYQDLRQTGNAFYMDAQYAQPGETVTMELKLGGTVCLSSIELTLSFDAEVLLDFRCETKDSPFEIVSQDESSVTLRLDSAKNLTEAITAATIQFTVSPRRGDVERTTITVGMRDPIMLVSGSDTGTGSNAVHGDIYILS